MQFVPFVVFIPILIAVGICDFKKSIIPNKITYPAAIAAILLNALLTDMPFQNIIIGGFLSFILGSLLSRYAKLGGGDVKLMVVIGLMFGHPWFLAVLLGGFMIGGLITFVLWCGRRIKIDRNERIIDSEPVPFGVHLSISGIVVSGWLMFLIALG